MRVRKKPVEVEALQFNGRNQDEILRWAQREVSIPIANGLIAHPVYVDRHSGKIFVRTLEGKMEASPDDWIICGVNKEFYPCKPDIFNKTYEVIP